MCGFKAKLFGLLASGISRDLISLTGIWPWPHRNWPRGHLQHSWY